ncbi:hypothetical protein IY971_01275 [Campylobacter volucris]|uniref:hypothetical protein n=1 Tax=Campylobacter volucris TaxID=1031542 RepID=UPI00189F27F8|nr:hypothetical protein [Campylobacter volucris]MBF7042053.1 hypothetical protein [Campylobacter volucris]
MKTLLSFCEILNNQNTKEQNIFEDYYIGYKLPQIEKEFDLLKIGENTIINIELKSEYIDENKILLQLKRNYYLSMLNKKLDDIVFNSDISAHKSIGQEYDNILVVIDKYFYYNDNNLDYKANTYYNLIETLFQAMSRVRKKLFILIIDNKEIYINCVKIINNVN